MTTFTLMNDLSRVRILGFFMLITFIVAIILIPREHPILPLIGLIMAFAFLTMMLIILFAKIAKVRQIGTMTFGENTLEISKDDETMNIDRRDIIKIATRLNGYNGILTFFIAGYHSKDGTNNKITSTTKDSVMNFCLYLPGDDEREQFRRIANDYAE